MTITALLSRSANMAFLKPMLEAVDPSLDIVVWPDPRFAEAEVAVCWNSPPGVYAEMPKLKLVHSIASGVDNVVSEQTLGTATVCRVVDPMLAEGMLQYVLWAVLYYHRKLDAALDSQRKHEWSRPKQTPASACRVGLMGLGETGGRIAAVLPTLGYTVNGWSRTPKDLPGVNTFHGEEGFAAFLAQTDVLVCLVPLTDATRGILSKATFAGLPRGAALVHCGRGEHLVEADLIAALAEGQLRGAVLDVFEKEPLHKDSLLWDTPGVIVTPHMATMAAYDVIATQVAQNIGRLRDGSPFRNTVDLSRGY